MCVLLAACVTASAVGGGRPGTPQSGRKAACVYARFSTRFQDSTDDQVRECREWADQNGYEVLEEYVFVDRAKRGGSSRRSGLAAMHQAIEEGKVNPVVIFATSRLFRKTYRGMQFVHEEIVARGIRCVLVKSGIDTANKNDWETRLHVQSLVDEYATGNWHVHSQPQFQVSGFSAWYPWSAKDARPIGSR